MSALSRRLLRAELWAGGALVAIIFLLMPVSAIMRKSGHPLIWADELATSLMVWLAFIGASAAIAMRRHMTVGLLSETLQGRARRWLLCLCDLLVLIFIAVMGWLAWQWFDPVGLVRAGGADALAQASFNFTYSEPTLTLGIRKFWFWLIVPLTLVTSAIHGFSVLAEDMRGDGPPILPPAAQDMP